MRIITVNVNSTRAIVYVCVCVCLHVCSHARVYHDLSLDEEGPRCGGIEMVRRARRDSLTAGQLQEKPVFVTRERITAIDSNGSNKMQVASAAHSP